MIGVNGVWYVIDEAGGRRFIGENVQILLIRLMLSVGLSVRRNDVRMSPSGRIHLAICQDIIVS